MFALGGVEIREFCSDEFDCEFCSAELDCEFGPDEFDELDELPSDGMTTETAFGLGPLLRLALKRFRIRKKLFFVVFRWLPAAFLFGFGFSAILETA